MPILYADYKAKIIEASKNARKAETIDEALEIQAQGYTDALETAISQATVNTTVATTGTASAQTGTGTGTVE